MKKMVELLYIVFLTVCKTASGAVTFKQGVYASMARSALMERVQIKRTAERIWREDFAKGRLKLDPGGDDALATLLLPDLTLLIQSYLVSPEAQCVLAPNGTEVPVNREMNAIYREYQRRLIDAQLPRFIDLPGVSLAESADLDAIGIDIPVLNSFGAAETKTTVGLFKAVFGRYPDLTQCHNTALGRNFNEIEARAQYDYWDQHPNLPLVCTEISEDQLLARRLSKILGRKFSVMSRPRNAYMRRGRELVDGNPTGDIVKTTYSFGEAASEREVQYHAMISDFAPHFERNRTEDGVEYQSLVYGIKYTQAIGVDQAPDGHNIENYKNNFGIIHSSGLAWERDPEGEAVGGSFFTDIIYAKLSPDFRYPFLRHVPRLDDVSSRLAEEFWQ